LAVVGEPARSHAATARAHGQTLVPEDQRWFRSVHEGCCFTQSPRYRPPLLAKFNRLLRAL